MKKSIFLGVLILLSQFTLASFSKNLGPTKVDLLFVVDNSGSMGGHHKVLSNNADLIIEQFKYADLQVGLITADLDEAKNGNLFKGPDLAGDSKTIAWSLINTINHLGTYGSSNEQFIAPIKETFGKKGKGFHREDSELIIIIVTDEDESAGTVFTFATEILPLKPGKIKVHALLSRDQCQSDPLELIKQGYTGDRGVIPMMVLTTGGNLYNLCDTDWSNWKF